MIYDNVIVDFMLHGTMVGRVVILIILILFAVSVYSIIKNILRILKEKEHLALAKKKYDEAEAENLTAHEIVERLLQVVPGSMVRRRIHSLYKIRSLHSISAEMLNRLDQIEESKNYRFLKFVTSILLILGLMGTVSGLAISIKHLAPAIQEAQKLADLTKLATAMAQTIGGLQTAFNSTLVSIVATFIIALLVLIAQKLEGVYFHQLEYFTTYDLMPKILITSEMEANTLYLEAIETSAKDISDAAELLEISQDGISTIVEGLVTATKTTQDRTVDLFNFVQKFSDSVANLMGYKDDIKITYDNIEKVLKDIKDNQITDQVIGKIVDKAIARSMSATNELTESVRATFKEDISGIAETSKKYAEVVEKAAESIKNFSTENADKFAEKIGEAFSKALDHFRTGLEQMEKREDISRMIALETNEQFQDYVKETMKTIRNSIESMTIQRVDKRPISNTHGMIEVNLEQ
jgi:biopolymer transport protein ExbB/TolQ